MFKKLREKRSEKLQNEGKRSDAGTLERKTAEIKEKLGRLSIGSIMKPRHSAPATTSHDSEGRRHFSIGDEIRRKDCNPPEPAVLNELPTPLLELILERCSFKDLVRGAALVHSTWHRYILSDDFMRRRLEGALPPQMLNFLEHWHGSWAQRAQAFYNHNLLSNPEFRSGGVTNAAGLGKVLETSKAWRAQVGCWQVEKEGLGDAAHRLAQNAGTRCTPRVLVLTTPSWAIPEAAQEINLVDVLVSRGFSKAAAAAYLDTSPALTFSVWCLCNTGQPLEWQRGFAALVLDNGEESGTGWRGMKMGSHILRTEAAAFWISWAPDSSLLVGSKSLPKRDILHTPRGQYKKLACQFKGYRKGVRRVQILLKGLDPKFIYTSNGKEMKANGHKPITEFIAPSLRFSMPSV